MVKSLTIETKIVDCPFCSARHDIKECDELQKATSYGCCQLIGDGHNSKTCTKRRKCRDCNGKHPTILPRLKTFSYGFIYIE